MTSAKNTALAYMYRDASNYKWSHTIVLEGTIRRENIQNYLIDGEFFLPRDIGLKCLTPYPRTEDDHDWHTIRSFTATTKPADFCSADDFINRFRHQYEKSWKYA